jgi:hypothetical protein
LKQGFTSVPSLTEAFYFYLALYNYINYIVFMTYLFGNEGYNNGIKIEAKSLEQAIRLFKVQELFPERYVADKHIKESNYNLVLKEEIETKRKAIRIIETFFGMHEEIQQLKEGKTSSEEEPLVLYQDVLYMDEEVGIWEEGGLDYTQIEVFDEWVVKNYDKFLYAPKSVRAFRVRRKNKKYSDDAWVNCALNQGNFESYLLIRNGDNFYRIWSNVVIPDKLFPSLQEYAKVYEEYKDWGEERAKKYVKERHESYIFGLIAIQGLIERTDTFGNSLRGFVNLMKPNGIPEDKIKLVRDGEKEFWLSSRSPWDEFIKKNQETVTLGTRVVLRKEQYSYGSHKDENWRVSPYQPSNFPAQKYVYQVEELGDKDSYHRYKFKIYYNPKDTVYRRWDYSERKRRVPFCLYSDEVINFDQITIEDCDYYEKNRMERSNYLSLLPLLHWIKLAKIEEQKLDSEFIKLIAGQLNWDEKRFIEIQKAVDWWKLKNKWKRGLMTDDAKAVRMIVRKLNNLKD